MSKKYIALLLMAVLMLFAVSAVAATPEDELTGLKFCTIKDHKADESNEGLISRKASTCNELGYEYRYCKTCWDSGVYTSYRTVKLTEYAQHNTAGAALPKIDATCTAPGKNAGNACSVCGKDMRTEIRKLPHQWQLGCCKVCGKICLHNWVTTEAGTRECSICDAVCEKCSFVEIELVPGTANCTTKGYFKKVCRTCGKTEYKYDYKHDFEEQYKAPTCYESGKTAKVCKLCGAVDGQWTDVPNDGPLNHPNMTFDKTLPYKAATCTENGYGTLVCTCGYREYHDATINPILALDHDLDKNVKVNIPATCGQNESYGYPCKRCGKTIREDDVLGGKPATGEHKYDWVITTAPTCTSEGEETLKCTVCGMTKPGDERTQSVPKADHKYTVTVLREATCTQVGIERRVCSVCKENTVKVVPMNHNYKAGEGYVPATCVKAAQGKLVCATCGKVIYANEVETATGKHTYVENYFKAASCNTLLNEGDEGYYSYIGTYCSVCELLKDGTEPTIVDAKRPEHTLVYDYYKKVNGELVYKAPTCKEEGKVWVIKCSACEDTTVQNTELKLDKVDHAYGAKQYIPATCNEPAQYGQVCKDCGAIKEGATVVEGSTKLGHDYKEYTFEGDCKNPPKYYEKYCTRCKDVEEGSVERTGVLDTTAHKLDKVAVLREATCTVTGIVKYACKVEGCDYETVKTTKVEHEWDEASIKVLKDPTCADKGENERTCLNCKKTFKYEVDATGKHNFVKDYVKPATCTQGAVYGHICTVCGKAAPGGSATVISAPKDHNYVVKTDYVDGTGKLVYKAPTCTKAGLGYMVCSECGDVGGIKVLDATGHKWGADKMNAAGTVLFHTCKYCGLNQIIQVFGEYDKDDECAKFEHSVVSMEAVEATCTKTGLTEGAKCDRCGEILVAQVVIPKLAHTEEELPAVEATCTATGLTAGKKCTVCGEITLAQEEIAKKPHAFNGAEKCPDCGEANPDYVNHVHEYTVKWSLHPTDKTKKVATYTCVNKIGDKVCTHTYTEEYGLFEAVAK